MFCGDFPLASELTITVTSWWARWCLKSPASRLFTQPFIQAQIKRTAKLRVPGLYAGNSSVTGEFPAQMVSDAQNFSIWWCNNHYVKHKILTHPLELYVSTAPNILSMMTSSYGNIFRVTSPLCGEFTGPGEFPAQRPVTRSFDVFFDLRLNKQLSKQP